MVTEPTDVETEGETVGVYVGGFFFFGGVGGEGLERGERGMDGTIEESLRAGSGGGVW